MICLSGVCTGSAQQDDGDPIIIMPAQGINPGSGYDITKVFVEIQWNDEGDGIYFHIEFNVSISMLFIVNSTTAYNLQVGSGAITQDLAVNGFLVIDIDNIDSEFILPYDDTFYFMILNSRSIYAWMTGWYAKDTHAPVGVVNGIESGNRFDRGDDIDIYVYYEADRFNITDLYFGRGMYTIRHETLNADGPVNWTVTLNTGSMQYGDGYINFTVVDGAGNSDSVIIDVHINTIPVEPEPVDTSLVINLVIGIVVLGTVIGLASYRNIRKDEPEDTRTERPYKKTHRDRKDFKKAS